LAAAVVANIVLAGFVVMAMNEEPSYPPLVQSDLTQDNVSESKKSKEL
jgi:hypothetical protein